MPTEAKLRCYTARFVVSLEDGNWNARGRGSYFNRGEFRLARRSSPVGHGPTVRRLRAGPGGHRPSAAAPDPDYTQGVRLTLDRPRCLVIGLYRRRGSGRSRPSCSARLSETTSTSRAAAMHAQRRELPVEVALFQDPGQAGKHQIQTLERKLSGFVVNRVGAAEQGDDGACGRRGSQQGQVFVIQGDWNEGFFIGPGTSRSARTTTGSTRSRAASGAHPRGRRRSPVDQGV